MRKNTKIEMPCGNGKALTREFIKAYTDVQLDVWTLSKKDIQIKMPLLWRRFGNAHA